MASTGAALSVIALISGGKDSFFSILHCQANGHRVVALANLHPSPSTPGATPSRHAGHDEVPAPRRHDSSPPLGAVDIQEANSDTNETDLNSFMYQTVGHQIIPLYAHATGLPLHRQPILGTAVHRGLSYHYDANPAHTPQGAAAAAAAAIGSISRPPDAASGSSDDDTPPGHGLDDETESLVPLLRAVLEAHPGANAVCTGAILSTYQRTRVESVALRLGLVPLSYLWQFTELPASIAASCNCHDQVAGLADKVARDNSSSNSSSSSDIGGRRSGNLRRRRRRHVPARDDARLLRDMAAARLEARIVKVASAGLDEGFLWENVASSAGVQRMERAMRRFGAAAGGRGSILGEGGEFETIVIDGPPSLFKGRIVIADEDTTSSSSSRCVIREGGGCAWLRFPRADVVQKDLELEQAGRQSPSAAAAAAPGAPDDVRPPELLDPRFEDTLRRLLVVPATGDEEQLPSGFANLSLHGDSASSDRTSDLSSLTLSTGLPRCRAPLSPESSPVQEWCYFGDSGAESPNVEDQTGSIVDQIRRRLDKHDLPATAITNSVIVLRRMSDFPIVNEHYGSLFNEPNPPSRVTISCGDKLLPKGALIAVYLTVQLRLRPDDRRGLHVQSRSYWAPANIGPYSQAIAFPLLPLSTAEQATGDDAEDEPTKHSHSSSSPFAVSIAGQIPLVPASMALPAPSSLDQTTLQITLALQHLWRVGIEMHVRWWTSAVAYFPAASSEETMRHNALLAASAWKFAHLWPTLDGNEHETSDEDDSDDDNAGPDLWDRRYNSQFQTYGGDSEEESFPLSLPNWGVVKGFDIDDEALFENKSALTPFFFAAEVAELPRQAGVEWHAHLGLAELAEGSVSRRFVADDDGKGLELHHVVVEAETAVFVQTVAVVVVGSVVDGSLRGVGDAVSVAVAGLLGLPGMVGVGPKITYLVQQGEEEGVEDLGAVVPCRSLWDARGRGLAAVVVFETRVVKE